MFVVLSSKYNTFTTACFEPNPDNKSSLDTIDNLTLTGSFEVSTRFKISLSARLFPYITDSGLLSTNVGKNVALRVPFSADTNFSFFCNGSI